MEHIELTSWAALGEGFSGTHTIEDEGVNGIPLITK
jgi:hypothetical protein